MKDLLRLLFTSTTLFLISCQSTEYIDYIPQENNSYFPIGDLEASPSTVEHWSNALEKHFNRLHKYARFNGNVLVARKGNVIYSGSFGVQDLKTKDSLNINSLFQIASVSKTFTAMAIMLLVEDDAIKLDQEIIEFFPDFPYSGVTVKDLLTHRSGLPKYLYTTEVAWKDQGLKTNKDVLKHLIEEHPNRQGNPDRFFAYNNTNYALLPLIIEQASGMPFSEFMQVRIFNPLGMKDTYIYSADHQNLPQENITTGYTRRDIPDKLVATDGIVGDKNIYSTVGDLLKWERANSQAYLFQQSTLDSVIIGRSNEKLGRKNYGYGWRILNEPQKDRIIYHTGWWHGYTAILSRNPKDETVIIILSNIFNRATYRIQPVWDILYNKNANHLDP